MQLIPRDFLENMVVDRQLSPEQQEALFKRLGDSDTELEDAEKLHISKGALRSRMSGVYKKFNISGKGPGKLRSLHDYLFNKYQKDLPKTSDLSTVDTGITELVQKIRQKVKADIHNRCGTMRVLDMEQPIGIGEIYTSVNILEKLSGRQRLGVEELWQDCKINNFDRLMLGQVRVERVPGLEAVERYNKLMILGKPGAGKTTFMKRLATQCNQGKFESHRIPVFVTLKEFAEALKTPDLQSYIAEQWRTCDVEKTDFCQVLKAGCVLVLLDGLDEVQATEHDRVLTSIKGFTEQFRDCQCVMTCRIAAREYTFEKFTEVEVADFNEEQIKDFSTKWFRTKKDPEKGKTFIKRLQDNKPIQELSTNPLLLTLLCLVFGEANDFPHNRSELYKEGLDVLLRKWDGKRNIERDQVYKKLSLKRKEDLLSQLAYQTFEQGDYFFKQPVVETKIIDYIRNLPDANEDEEALQLDSEAVLKSIEAQHGLLVERARGIYSFSHLTLQEYFTAKQITCPTPQLPIALKNLATHCQDKRYREVFFLVVEMLPEADDFVRFFKSQVDQLIADDPLLQKFLVWVSAKAQAVKVKYELEAVRAYISPLTSIVPALALVPSPLSALLPSLSTSPMLMPSTSTSPSPAPAPVILPSTSTMILPSTSTMTSPSPLPLTMILPSTFLSLSPFSSTMPVPATSLLTSISSSPALSSSLSTVPSTAIN